jgi:hypothetical protein
MNFDKGGSKSNFPKWQLIYSSLHQQFVLAKTSAILSRDYATPSCLAHPGLHDTNRNNPICVAPAKVTRASGVAQLQHRII